MAKNKDGIEAGSVVSFEDMQRINHERREKSKIKTEVIAKDKTEEPKSNTRKKKTEE